MRNFNIIVENNQKVNSESIKNTYGSDEKALLALYTWDKAGLIKMDKKGDYYKTFLDQKI